MTTTADRPKGTTLQRSLLVGGLVLVTVFPGRLYLVPLHPVLDGPLVAALMAASLAAGAWWVAFRRRGGEPARGRAPQRGDMDRTVRLSLLYAAAVLVLFLLFRFCVLPLFPQVDGWLAAALAGGASGAVAPWLVRLFRRP